MTNTILTADQIQSMTAKQLRPVAQELSLPGAWKATKAQLQDMLTAHYAQASEPTKLATEDIQEVTCDLWDGEPTPIKSIIQPTPNTPKQLLLLNPAPLPEPSSKSNKKAKKAKPAKKSYTTLQSLTDDQVALIHEQSTITNPSCSDPDRLVVKRDVIRQLIEDTHSIHINEKVFNQLVVIASRKLPRQPLTIQSASRFKYLLVETAKGQTFPPAILVADWLLTHPEVYSQAALAYQSAAQTGLKTINEYLSSK